MNEELIERTMSELECKALHPLRWMVFVRTCPLPVKTDSGLLWLPPSQTQMYPSLKVEMPHERILKGVVLAAGPKAPAAKPGDMVLFKRLHFAYWKKMADGTYVGWIDYNQLIGFPEDDHGSVNTNRAVPREDPCRDEEVRGSAGHDCR